MFCGVVLVGGDLVLSEAVLDDWDVDLYDRGRSQDESAVGVAGDWVGVVAGDGEGSSVLPGAEYWAASGECD